MSAGIDLENVCCDFGTFRAVDNANVSIKPGEFFSFLGPSGCGKTTILRMISGFIDPTHGQIKIGGKEMDFRVNTLPTLFGEKVVLRLLSKGNLQLDLKKLGFEEGQLEIFQKGIHQPSGMVLVTGPTGSGKTTTLYSALMELNQISDNLSTVEDPVEYNLEGINQVQVNKDVGLTFASILRALLRQDPDTVLVGEIRDLETAEVAIQAALTGHLVLSTLHTNDTVATITRLVNMGCEPFMVTSSVNTIIAQRLLRTVRTRNQRNGFRGNVLRTGGLQCLQ